MPLVNAPEPEDSNLYRQLSSEQLGTASKTNFDITQDSIYLDSTSEDELRRVNLIGQASNLQSQSGPISGTQKIVQVETTGGAATLFRPEAGTVWELVGVSQIRTGGSGSTTTALRIADGSDTVLIEEFADNSGEAPLATSESHPIRITYDNYLTIGYSPGANATKITGYASVIQVR